MTGAVAPPAVTAEHQPAFGGQLHGTEGLRGIFCVLIIWYHTYLYTGAPSDGSVYIYGISRAQLGLSMFFMLSAFLLYRPFVQSIMRGKPRPAFGAYLANRVLRIFPAYWAILAAAALAGATVVWIPTHDVAFHLPTFLGNLFFVHGLHPSSVQTGIPPSWSLTVEWGFYLTLPLLVMLALRVGGAGRTIARRRTAVLIPAGLLLVVGLIGREVSRRTVTPEDPNGVLNTWHAVIDKSFFSWADLFAIGMMIAVLRVDFEDGRLRRLPSWWRAAAFGTGVALTAAAIWAQGSGRLDWHHYNSFMGIAIALMFAAVVIWDGNPNRDPLLRILSRRPAVFLGNISLSIYLIHYPVIVYFLDKGVFRPGWDGMALNVAFVTSITVTLSYLSYRFVELPFMTRKVRTKAAGPPPVDEAGPAAVLAPEPSRA